MLWEHRTYGWVSNTRGSAHPVVSGGLLFFTIIPVPKADVKPIRHEGLYALTLYIASNQKGVYNTYYPGMNIVLREQ